MAAGAVAGQSGGVDEALASVVSFAAATPSGRTAWHLLDEVLPVCDQCRRGGLLLAGLQRSDERWKGQGNRLRIRRCEWLRC